MQETKAKAIVLGGIDYKDKDMLVNLFTLERGIVSVVFRGVKSPNAKLKSAKEVFSFGDFIYSDGKLRIVTSAEIIDSFYDITKDLKKYYTACAIIEAIKTVVQPNEANPKLFVATLKCLNLLTEKDVNLHNVINKFLIEVFESVGYSFSLKECNNCGATLNHSRFMNLNYGDITCSSCRVGTTVELTTAVYNTLRIYSNTPYEKLLTLKIPQENNQQVLKLLLLNFKHRFNKTLTLII